MKAVLYCRVSSEEQTRGFSLNGQKDLGVVYGARGKIEIVKIFLADESAAHEGREVFNQAVQYLVRHKDVEALLVSKMDRAIRNLPDMARMDKLAHHGQKQIHFFEEGWIYDKNSSIADFYRFGFMSVMATGFSRNLSDITKLGMKRKAESGQYPSKAPFGYRNTGPAENIAPDP